MSNVMDGAVRVLESERREIVGLSSIEIGVGRGRGVGRGMMDDGGGIESDGLNGEGG